MKSIFLLLFSVFFVPFVSANPGQSAGAHLMEVNKLWDLAAPKSINAQNITFSSDQQRIQFHISEVVSKLREAKNNGFTSQAWNHRSRLIQELEAYGKTGLFPTNNLQPGRVPVFIDDFGVHCAVGYLIAISGNEELAQEINRTNRLSYIHEIQDPELLTWAKAHGFQVSELALIQPGYQFAKELEPVGLGVNAPIKGIIGNDVEGANARKFIWGDFTELDGEPCLGIGEFRDDQLYCLGAGIAGTINSVKATRSNHVFAAGSINHNNQVYPIAHYQDGNWSYLDVPTNINGFASFVSYEGVGFPHINLVVAMEQMDGTLTELWEYDFSSETWSHTARLNGVVRAGSYINEIYLGGDFSEVTLFDHQGQDSIVYATNLIAKEYKGAWLVQAYSHVPDSVLSLKSIGHAIYLGGQCSPVEGKNVCLSRVINEVNQPLLTYESFQVGGEDPFYIKSIEIGRTDGNLLYSGKFSLSSLMSYGSNIGIYNIISNYTAPLNSFQRPITGAQYIGEDLLVVGDIPDHLGTTINHIGIEGDQVGIESSYFRSVDIGPNPVQEFIQISGVQGPLNYQILGTNGAVIDQSILPINGRISCDNMKPGVYLISLEHNNQTFRKKFIKS